MTGLPDNLDVCLDPLVLLRKAHEGQPALNSYLAGNLKAKVQPPTGTEFGLNFIFHVFVLFTALTVLFQLVISPLEKQTLAQQMGLAAAHTVDSAFSFMEGTAGKDKAAVNSQLQAAVPMLERMRVKYSTPDAAMAEHNKGVVSRAYGIVIGLAIVLVVFVSALAGSGIDMSKPVLQVLFENLIVFSVVGTAEYAFFALVASKFAPVMPSAMAGEVLATMKAQFAMAPA